MQYPTPQGSASKTFRAPPLDGTLALHALPEFHAKNSPDHPVFRYEDPSNGGIKSLRWPQVFLAIQAARQILQGNFGVPTTGTHPVVAILVNTDTMSYFTVIHGLMQAGFVPFPISIRNSAAAVLHLLKETNCTRMIVGHDQHLQTIANTVSQQLGPIQNMRLPSFASMYHVDNSVRNPANEPTPSFEWTDTAVIFHSSGTTRFPSPIYLNHRHLLQYASIPYYGEIDLCGYVCAAQGPPLYHVMGFMWTGFMISSGFVLAVFPPTEPPVVPTSDRCLASASKLGCNVMFTVPSFLENWSRDPASIEALKAFTFIRYGGGPLSKEAGDTLSSHGVPLSASYGLTEVGGVGIIPKTPPSVGWEWIRVAPYMDTAFVPVEENIFRLYIKESSTLTPAVLNAEIDGVRAFDTKDLLIRHPVNPGYWKIYGRADDQIVHSTGEKTNPVPIEVILQGDKHVAHAIMFGRAKFQCGVLILPRPEYAFDPTDSVKLADFRNKIWDTVMIANEQSPQHSRIYKEMILVANPSKPFEYTSKGTLRRGAIIDLYHDEIEGIYNAVDDISRTEAAPPDSWDLKNVTIFVRSMVQGVLAQPITDDINIFDVGGDSLTATSIRNSLLRAMHQSKAVPLSAIRLLPQNFVFEYPTIIALSAFIRGFVIGSFRVPSAQETKEDEKEKEKGFYPGSTALPMSGQTVVKLFEGKGETPLIMIHGAGGFFFEYAAYAEKFRSAVWTLQVTPETPLTTLDEMAAFYFAKIKEQQPTGPYRLAAYSSTSILAFALAKLFENNGDDVVQLAMLDHFPPLFVYSANRLGNIDPRNPVNREKLVALSRENISGLMRRDANWELLKNQLPFFLDASKGLPAPVLATTAANTVKKYITLVADYVYDLTTDSTGVSSLELMVKWMSSVKAPVCVYAARTGSLGAVADEDKEDWADLGAKYLPGTRVVLLEGGHYEFLMNEKVIRGLQEGF